MKEKRKKGFKLFVTLLLVVCLFLVGYFVLFNENQVKTGSTSTSSEYKMVKLLDYSEEKDNKNGTNLIDTGKYYILEYSIDYKQNVILYDKEGNDVTKEKIGYDNIETILIPNNAKEDYKSFIVRTKDKKYGLFDKSFNEKIAVGDYEIDNTGNDNYFIVGSSINNDSMIERLENVGLYDKNGNVVIPREYERLFFGGDLTGENYYGANKILLYARKNGKYGIIDVNNKVIIPFEYDRENSKLSLGLGEIFESNSKNYFILYKNGKYGVVDENNKTIISFDKNKLIYNKYANAIFEKVYNDNKLTKINVYSIDGELKKEIIISDSFGGDFNSYYYKIGYDSLVLHDNDYIYILNNKFEYDKYIKPSNIGYGKDSNLYLAFDNIYLKGSNQKYKVYKTSDNSLLFNDEYYLKDGSYITSNKMLILCKNKNNEANYSSCGIIDKDGKIIVDFIYRYYINMENDNELIDLVYNEKSLKYDINKKKVSGDCVKEQDYYIVGNAIKTDSGVYDLKCNKISENVSNVYSINDNLILTEVFEEKEHNTYQIYDVNTKKIANIENSDGAIITNEIRTNQLADQLDVVITDKGIYRIVVK